MLLPLSYLNPALSPMKHYLYIPPFPSLNGDLSPYFPFPLYTHYPHLLIYFSSPSLPFTSLLYSPFPLLSFPKPSLLSLPLTLFLPFFPLKDLFLPLDFLFLLLSPSFSGQLLMDAALTSILGAKRNIHLRKYIEVNVKYVCMFVYVYVCVCVYVLYHHHHRCFFLLLLISECVFLYVCVPERVSVCLSIRLSVCLSVCFSALLSVCLAGQ